MADPKQQWKRLMRAWKVGAACQREHARRYVRDYPDRFGGWIALADALWNLARYREAQAALRTAERLVPSRLRYRVWEQWGHLYNEKNDLLKAERWYRKALRAKPSTRRHILLGATLAKRGHLVAAMTEHRAAIRLSTKGEPVDEAHFNLALIFRAEGKYRDAADHLQKALSVAPNYRVALEVLRDVQQALIFVMPANKALQPTSRMTRRRKAKRAKPARG